MFNSGISITETILALVFSIFVIGTIFIFSLLDGSTKIVFCNVGQGDGTYIRIKNRIDILIDAGPDRSILNCLGKYMPFYDREIEYAINTHPEKDHFGGFLYLIDRYKIDSFVLNPISSSIISFKQLEKKIITKKIKVYYSNETSKIILPMGSIIFYWPALEFLNKPNDASMVFSYNEASFKALFTGDASPFALTRLLDKSKIKCDLLKVPHHGSKNGLTKEFLNLAEPDIAVISAGKNNRYGHPSKEILDMLKAKNIKIRRTDLEGDVLYKIKNKKLRN